MRTRITTLTWLVLALVSAFSSAVQAATKPNLVLLPIEVQNDELELSGDFGTAIQSGLQSDYRVFFGRDVETELVKIYQKLEQKIDCDAGLCNREVALAFNAKLVADSSVRKVSGGYMARLHIRNVRTGEVVRSSTLPCKGCDAFELMERLPALGRSSGSAASTSSVVQQSNQSVAAASNQRAILIIDSQPSGAAIAINGKSAGVTPYQGLDHKQGQQLTVTLEKQHYLRKELTVRLNQSITELAEVSLKQGQGELLVITEPYQKGVSVSLNGKQVGTAPYQASVAAGKYQINIKTTDGRVGEVDKTVEHSKETKVTFNVKSKAKTDQKARTYSVGGVDFKLVKIPSGSFKMGSNNGKDREKPVHRVNISRFYMMEHEVTFALWDACVSDGKCERPNDRGWGRGSRPVINVSWNDITKKFIPWLNRKTDKTFRLPSESEWEYAARAGTATDFSTGNCISTHQANYDGNYDWNNCGAQTGVYRKKTLPVKSFSPNAFGLYDMHGNVWEWVQDCWNDHYNNGPYNNRAWESGDCERRVLRGGSWYDEPSNLRSANRVRLSASDRDNIGFRLVQAP